MHDGHRERLRKRFQNVGLDGFADHEALELLLCYAIARKDVNPIAHELLNKYKSLESVFSADINDLQNTNGIGESAATLISLIFAMMKRIRLQAAGARPLLDTPEKACAYCSDLFRGQRDESFYLLMVDSNQKLIRAELMSQGTNKETPVYPRKVVEVALRHGADSVFLAHNHPGCNVTPSVADITLTKTITEALGAIGITCLDHIIVTQNSSYMLGARKLFADESLKAKQLPTVSDPYQMAEMLKALNSAELQIVIDTLNQE